MEHEHHILSYKKLGLVLGALLGLTVVTVLAARVDFGYLNVLIAMAIASCKASLVVFFFMHLKYENRTIQLMVLTCFVILAIFISFTFFDIAYR